MNQFYPDHKYDDIYIDNDQEETEPMKITIDQYASEKLQRKLISKEEKSENQDTTTPLKDESPKRMSLTRKSTVIRRKSSQFSITSLSNQKVQSKKKEQDLFLLRNAPKQVEEWEDQGNIGKSEDQIKEELSLIESLRKKVNDQKSVLSQNLKGKDQLLDQASSNREQQISVVQSVNNQKPRRLPNLFSSFTQSKVTEEISINKQRVSQTKKIKKNESQQNSKTLLQSESKFLQNQNIIQVDQEVKPSLSSKEHFIPSNGVTFQELENQKRSMNDNQNYKKGPEYYSQFNGTKMSMSQYKTMQGFKMFGCENPNKTFNNDSQSNQTIVILKKPKSNQSRNFSSKVGFTSINKKRIEINDKNNITQNIDDVSLLYQPYDSLSQKQDMMKSAYKNFIRPISRETTPNQSYHNNMYKNTINKTSQSFYNDRVIDHQHNKTFDMKPTDINLNQHQQKQAKRHARILLQTSNIKTRKKLI